MLELVDGGSVIKGPILSLKKDVTVKNYNFKIGNEGLSHHPNIVQLYTVVVNKLASLFSSYACANKPNVHSG